MKKVLLGVMTAMTLVGGVANAHPVQNEITNGQEVYKHHVVQSDDHGEYIETCSIDTKVFGCWQHEKHYLTYDEEASIPGDPGAAAGPR